MKQAIRFILWGIIFTLPLMACATTDYDIEQRKAISEDNRRLGDAYIRQGDYTRALRYYLEAAKHYSDDPDLQYSMGLAYQEKKNYRRAIEHFKHALELKPDMAPAKNSLGVAYIRAQDYDQAILILKDMIEDQSYEIYMTPQYPKYNLGWAYYQKKQYEEAERYFQEALDYYDSGIPKDAIYIKGLRAMGLNALAQSRPERALSYLEKAVPLAPKWPELFLDIARAHRLAGEMPRARQAYNRVIELAPASDIAETAAQEAAGLK
ncbi:MAG: tetratricopeptide repeat protein [Desulfobacterales bacterium]|jgi:tetratricopeptide (TPR) repeat protein